MIRCLWYCQVDDIIDVKLGDSDTDSYKYEPMTRLLARWETIKKDKHGKQCHDQRGKFLFVISVEGSLGREALVVFLQLSIFVADKRGEYLSQVWRWVNVRIAIAAVRSYSRMICGARLPSPLREQEPDWGP